jgi:hypothetical protein
VEAAVGLWQGYFRPHAAALFDRAVPTQLEQRVRRVARWLPGTGQATVSREDIRRDALLQSAKAVEVDGVLHRLEEAGFLRLMAVESSRLGGPRARRAGRSIQCWLRRQMASANCANCANPQRAVPPQAWRDLPPRCLVGRRLAAIVRPILHWIGR